MPTDPSATPPAPAAAPVVAPPVIAVDPVLIQGESLQTMTALSSFDAVAEERTRCAGIQSAARPEFTQLAALAVSSGWPLAQFVAAQAASDGAVTAARTAAQTDAFRSSLPVPVGGGGGGDDLAPTDPATRSRAEWDADPKLRAEFGTVERLASFRSAEATGRVRVLSRRD